MNGEIIEKIFSLFYKKKSKNVSFFDYVNANEYLNIVSKGNEGALYLQIGKYNEVAEKIAFDLYFSNDETYKRYAAQLLGFIVNLKKPLFIYFYRKEKQYYNSLMIDDVRRDNSMRIIEDLIISTAVRFDLVYQNQKSLARLSSDWINFLFEVVSDSINGYKWNSFQLALSILSFHFYREEWFKILFAKYEEYIVQTTDKEKQINRNLFDEIKTRNGETEMFESFLNNVVIPKMNVAENCVLDDHEEYIVNDVINFLK
jgi:hypothetical protein